MRSESRNRERTRKPAYDRGLDLLARRPHFAAELRSKLGQRGYGEAEVQAAVERLVAGGYVDDRETARLLVRSLQRRGYGRRRLELDLSRRGVEASTVLDTLADIDDEGELERAGLVAARWRSGHPSQGVDALARHLERRGFAARTIGAVLFDLSDGGSGAGEQA